METAEAYDTRKVILLGRSSDARLAVGERLNTGTENLPERVRESTDGHLLDVVLEATGNKEVWPEIVSILAPRARIAMTGLFGGAKLRGGFRCARAMPAGPLTEPGGGHGFRVLNSLRCFHDSG